MSNGSPTPCFVINLKKDHQRRQNIEKEFAAIGLPFVIVDAIYGKEMAAEEIANAYNKAQAIAQYRDLAVNEIATSLSHLSVYKKMIDEHIPYALILEDDARLSPCVSPVLDALKSKISPEDPQLVLLTHHGHYTRLGEIQLTDRHYLSRPVGRHLWLAHGYFVTLAAAKRMLNALYPIWLPADHWHIMQNMMIVDIRLVTPYCIGHSDHARNSNLEEDRNSKSKFYKPNTFWKIRVWEQIKKLSWPFRKIVRQRQTW